LTDETRIKSYCKAFSGKGKKGRKKIQTARKKVEKGMEAGKTVFVGVDIGASRAKAVVLGAEKDLLGYAVERSGTDFEEVSMTILARALEMAGVSREQVAGTVSTGYGRNNVPYARSQKTEISCHSKGCYFYFPRAITIIDIGGQDNKIIKLDEKGRRLGFKMNRKCAAGTGAFLEEMSFRLNIPLEEMDALARRSEDPVRLGSFCTVFSATEVLENIRKGKKVPDIVKGLFHSVIQRVLEMDALTEEVVMTGGVVAHNPYLVPMTEEIIGRPVLVPPYPQLTGAVGAALYAMEEE
jgi:predicted CoA-substrate-specific enzyme activase